VVHFAWKLKLFETSDETSAESTSETTTGQTRGRLHSRHLLPLYSRFLFLFTFSIKATILPCRERLDTKKQLQPFRRKEASFSESTSETTTGQTRGRLHSRHFFPLYTCFFISFYFFNQGHYIAMPRTVR